MPLTSNKMAPIPTELRQRTTVNDIPPEGASVDRHDDVAPHTDRKLVGIAGVWYDVTTFMKRHPGGEIIERYAGHDATVVYEAMGHKPGFLKHMKVAGTYTVDQKHGSDSEFNDLVKFFKREGYFETNKVFYLQKISFCALLWATAFFCILAFDSFFIHCLGGVALAFTWQQSGFVMHEFMHTQVTRNSKKDHRLAVIFGTVIFGMSSHWWRDEHRIHHAMTNTVDVSTNFADPQMWEGVWAENEKLFPLFQGYKKTTGVFSVMKAYLQYYLIKIQHITFVPIVTMCGRAEILSDSTIKERRPIEFAGFALHWLWITWLFSHLPTWNEVIVVYAIAAFVEGIFHFQLILSHYCRLFLDVGDFHDSSWFVYQVLSNMNIDSPRWLDWYYGGLNFHIEHHLFPTMARGRLRDCSPYVRDICKRHKIQYESQSFFGCLVKTLKHLKVAGTHYKLDFR